MRAWFRYSCIAGALAAALAAPASAQAASGKIVIMVGGIDKIIYLPAKLTEELGYFKDAGLDVELQSQQAGVSAENQLVAGAVQAVVGYYDHAIDLQSKGKSIESIVQRHPDRSGDHKISGKASSPVPVILITYATSEDAVRGALQAVQRDKVITGRPQVIRIEKN